MSQRGNILFLILLAVVLFAALSYAVTQSMSGGGKDASNENIEVSIAAMNQYVSLLRTEIQRLMMINDCKPENLDWRNGVYKRYSGSDYITTNPPSPKSGCAIFQARGGSITPILFDKYKDINRYNFDAPSAGTGIQAGHVEFIWVNFEKDGGTELNDIAIKFYGIDPRICTKIMNVNSVSSLSVEGYYQFSAQTTEDPPFTGAQKINTIFPAGKDMIAIRVTYNTSSYGCDVLSSVIIR